MTDPKTPAGFPHYRGTWPFRVRDGWSDLGWTGRYVDETCRPDENVFTMHTLCSRRVRVGRNADGTLFRYCPYCLVKTHE